MAKYDSRIKQADNGTYYFMISAGRYESGAKKGKRRQILRKSFKTKREAHEALVEIEYALKYGTFEDASEEKTPEKDKTVKDCVDKWLHEKKREINEDSLRYYMQVSEESKLNSVIFSYRTSRRNILTVSLTS